MLSVKTIKSIDSGHPKPSFRVVIAAGDSRFFVRQMQVQYNFIGIGLPIIFVQAIVSSSNPKTILSIASQKSNKLVSEMLRQGDIHIECMLRDRKELITFLESSDPHVRLLVDQK